jgi:hypothetical protein
LRKNQIIDDFLIFLIAWAVPGILLLASIDPRLHAGAQNSTSENLTKLSNNSKKFKNKFSRSPSNLRELIEYSKTIDSPASIYDNYGNKIELAQLDEKNWILRSHGPNTFAKESKGIHKNIFWAPRTWSGLFRVVSPNFQKPPYFYQPAYLLSMASHDRKYTATENIQQDFFTTMKLNFVLWSWLKTTLRKNRFTLTILTTPKNFYGFQPLTHLFSPLVLTMDAKSPSRF